MPDPSSSIPRIAVSARGDRHSADQIRNDHDAYYNSQSKQDSVSAAALCFLACLILIAWLGVDAGVEWLIRWWQTL